MRKNAVIFGVITGVVLLALGSVGMAFHHEVKVQAQAKAADAQPINGLPLHGPVKTPVTLPMLTRDDLVTRGHADDKAEIADLFYAYIFYHDSHNGDGVASLFTDDGILETLWNDGGKVFKSNAGPHGRGCLEYGHKEIADMFGYTPIPFPGHSHNDVTNVMIQVHGDTATLYANWTTVHSDDPTAKAPVGTPPNTAIVSHNGEYVSDLRRTPAGWRFTHHRAVEDEPAKFGTQVCENNVVGK